MDSSCKDIAVPVQCAAPVSDSLFCSAHLVSTQVLEMDSKHSLPAAVIPEIVSEQAGQPEDPSAPSAQTPPACQPPNVDQTPPACLPPDVDQTPPACLPLDVDQSPSVQTPPCGSPASDFCLSEPQGGLDSPSLSPADESTSPESLSSCSPPSSAEPSVVDNHFPFTAHEDDYCINAEEICFGQLLGQGGFGAVHLATYRGQTVAVKSFPAHRKEEVITDTYERELNALKYRLQHRNVVAVLGATCVEGWKTGACIVMQYAGGENLQAYMLNSNYSMPVGRVVDFTSQIAAGLNHIHSKKLIHMDIKPANCIVDTTDEQHPTLRITDFGLSNMESAPWNAWNLGTVPFRAPELFRGKLPSFSSDVYSLAVLMWCLDVRDLPYPNMSPEIIIWRTIASQMRPKLPESCDRPLLLQYRQLYQECWSADPAGRPTLQRLLNVLNEMQKSCSSTQPQ